MKMLQKQKITGVLLCMLLTAPAAALAGNSFTVNMPGSNGAQAVPVPWQQSTITLSQLQALVNQNPGQQLQIQFPNGMNWNVNQGAVQSMVNQYAQKASSLGLKQIPDVSFSSAENALRNAGNNATIPIQNAVSDAQTKLDSTLNDVRNDVSNKEAELKSQANSYLDSMPGWLRTLIQAIINGFTVLWNFARDTVSSIFR